MVKIAVSGSRGRMGKMILDLANRDPRFKIAGRFDKDDDAESAVRASDVLIEFTTPEATIKNLELALGNKKAMVIGTTGLSEEQQRKIENAAKSIPIVMSPNMAIGVNVLFKLAAESAFALDDSYKVSISETHHVHKKDSPSGTAKKLAQFIAEARKATEGSPKRSREISQDKIKIDAKRIGEVIGEHSASFDGSEETLTLQHSAKTRSVFAKGALEAANFIAGKPPALYNMFDVLGLK